MFRNNKAYARMTYNGSDHTELQVLSPESLSVTQYKTQFTASCEAITPRKALAFSYRQAPAYFEGRRTVSCFRPFLRRRLRTSRPQRVAIRSRKPWVRIRRLLRGRYVGLPMTTPNVRCREGKVDRRQNAKGSIDSRIRQPIYFRISPQLEKGSA